MSQGSNYLGPRDAMRLAQRLGWDVEPKRSSGAIVFRSPEGERYTCAAPGRKRADRVPLVLFKALMAAQAEKDQSTGDTGGDG